MVILYFRALPKYTGSLAGALHFAQTMYWYGKMKRAFFKPIKQGRKFTNSDNQDVLSWCEELSVSYEVLHTSMKQTCTKLKRGEKYDLRECGLILYWNGGYSRTYFIPNYPKMSLMKDLHPILEKNFPDFKRWLLCFSKLENPTYELVFDRIESWDSPVFYIKETTHKITNKIINEKFSLPGSIDFKNLDEFEKEKISAKKEKLIFPFQTPQFTEIWKAWKIYLKDAHQSEYSFYSEQAALKQLADYDEQFSINLIQTAIAKGWKSFHFSNTSQKYNSEKHTINDNSNFRKSRQSIGGNSYAYSKYK